MSSFLFFLRCFQHAFHGVIFLLSYWRTNRNSATIPMKIHIAAVIGFMICKIFF
nr:MAG TPA: hypothetical protein [Caudoviricetes sp.]